MLSLIIDVVCDNKLYNINICNFLFDPRCTVTMIMMYNDTKTDEFHRVFFKGNIFSLSF